MAADNAVPAPEAPAAPVVAAPPVADKKTFTLAECEQHTSHTDCWLILHEKVYDVTKYLDDHPGGGEVMLSVAGKDATNDFEDVGHSGSARSMLSKYVIGSFAGGASGRVERKALVHPGPSNNGMLNRLLQVLLPVFAILLAVLAYAIRPNQS